MVAGCFVTTTHLVAYILLSLSLHPVSLSIPQDWSVSLEQEAREAAGKCVSSRERGVNTFHNITQLPDNSAEALGQIVTSWLNAGIQQVCFLPLTSSDLLGLE